MRHVLEVDWNALFVPSVEPRAERIGLDDVTVQGEKSHEDFAEARRSGEPHRGPSVIRRDGGARPAWSADPGDRG